MTDRIVIRGLEVDTRIGVTDEERAHPQTLSIDVDVVADLSRAGRTDDLNDTIDYDSLVGQIAAATSATECKLLEHLAAKIADLVSAKPGVSGVTVRVGKKDVPVEQQVSSVSVSIERGVTG
jgi:7,8-dihydroneopterin aldolase/epimerase/oxygenase